MKMVTRAALAFVVALPLGAATWKDVPLMDANCAARPDLMAHRDEHSRACALQCARSGYGVIVADSFVQFDVKGSALAKEALSNARKKNHLRATVTGAMKDGVLHVSSLKLGE